MGEESRVGATGSGVAADGSADEMAGAGSVVVGPSALGIEGTDDLEEPACGLVVVPSPAACLPAEERSNDVLVVLLPSSGG